MSDHDDMRLGDLLVHRKRSSLIGVVTRSGPTRSDGEAYFDIFWADGTGELPSWWWTLPAIYLRVR
jgi:hypothetical protein